MSELAEIRALVTAKAIEAELDPTLLHAIVMTESGYNPWAVRFEQDYRWFYDIPTMASAIRTNSDSMKAMQQTSWGLTQVMGAVAYELGFRSWAPRLCIPAENLHWGIMHLKNLIKRQHLKDHGDIYAAWNAGSVKYKSDGDYMNQTNVNHFLRNLKLVKP